MRDLNARGRYEDVVHEFESGNVASNETTLGEYVKALVKLDRLDGSLLLDTIKVDRFIPNVLRRVSSEDRNRPARCRERETESVIDRCAGLKFHLLCLPMVSKS